MSGGVDSSAAAALLQEQGFDVVGVTLKLWPQDCVNRAEDKCCGPQAVMDARSVSASLGIPYYLIDESAEFQKRVIGYFAEEYRAGRTPNPCVMCNQHLKFGTLLDRARQLGCDLVATGHFAHAGVARRVGQDDDVAGEKRAVGTAEVHQHAVVTGDRNHLHAGDGGGVMGSHGLEGLVNRHRTT
jgi:tRNA-specific 2-thiouridylase